MPQPNTQSLQSLTQQLVHRLKRTNQLHKLPQLLKQSLSKRSAITVDNQAQVKTSVPLSKVQTKELADSLSTIFGRTISIENVVDPDTIAGLYIKVGDQVIDQTLASTVTSLGQKLLQ